MRNDDDSTSADLLAAIRDVESGLRRVRCSVLRSDPPVDDVVVLAMLVPTPGDPDAMTLRITVAEEAPWPLPGTLATLEYPAEPLA